MRPLAITPGVIVEIIWRDITEHKRGPAESEQPPGDDLLRRHSWGRVFATDRKAIRIEHHASESDCVDKEFVTYPWGCIEEIKVLKYE